MFFRFDKALNIYQKLDLLMYIDVYEFDKIKRCNSWNYVMILNNGIL